MQQCVAHTPTRQDTTHGQFGSKPSVSLSVPLTVHKVVPPLFVFARFKLGSN